MLPMCEPPGFSTAASPRTAAKELLQLDVALAVRQVAAAATVQARGSSASSTIRKSEMYGGDKYDQDISPSAQRGVSPPDVHIYREPRRSAAGASADAVSGGVLSEQAVPRPMHISNPRKYEEDTSFHTASRVMPHGGDQRSQDPRGSGRPPPPSDGIPASDPPRLSFLTSSNPSSPPETEETSLLTPTSSNLGESPTLRSSRSQGRWTLEREDDQHTPPDEDLQSTSYRGRQRMALNSKGAEDASKVDPLAQVESNALRGLKRPPEEDVEGIMAIDMSKRTKLTSEQRLERSRERNRIHARKTRQRKKLQMEKLQETLDQLKMENIALRRELDERIAAIKLLIMRSPDEGDNLLAIMDSPGDRDSERSADSMSEGGSSTSKTTSDYTDSVSSLGVDEPVQLNGMILGVAEMAEMDIDLELMKKDRSQCTPQELEQIRRERNRMHAKRTRVRKKAQLEDIQDTIVSLEKQNQELLQRISRINSQSAHVTVPGHSGGEATCVKGLSMVSIAESANGTSKFNARKTIG